jgi:hypothetical protein
MSAGGKGSAPRPMEVGRDQYSNNWDAIFKKEKIKNEYQDILSTEDCISDALEKMVHQLNSEKN